MASRTTHPVLGTRALNRATLARQLLLSRAEMSAGDAVAHLLGLQAQNVKPPYFQLHARLAGFRPAELAGLMESREVVRMVTMRSTIHTHTAHDALTLRPLVQPARDREVTYFRKGLAGVDLDRLAQRARAFVESEPRTMGEIREELLEEWPEADPQSLSVAARCRLPLVQVTPRGVWGRSGQVRLTTVETWLGKPAGAAQPVDEVVLRYLAAFGPASVKDMQTWAGLTRLREAFERLRPGLLVFRDENGVELFDLPDAPPPRRGRPGPAPLPPGVRQPPAVARRPRPRGRPRGQGAHVDREPGPLHPARGRVPRRPVEAGRAGAHRRAVRPGPEGGEGGDRRRRGADGGRDDGRDGGRERGRGRWCGRTVRGDQPLTRAPWRSRAVPGGQLTADAALVVRTAKAARCPS